MFTLIAVAVILVCLYLTFFNKRDPRLPPGVYGWPVIGHLPTSPENLLQKVNIFRKKFGDVFLWRLGSRTSIYICDPKLIKKAYMNANFTDRPKDLFTFDTWSNNGKLGIINNNGADWQMHRRFALRYLRDSGFGKSTVEDIIDWEAENLIKDLQANFLNSPVLIPNSVNVATINVIWKLAADIRFERNDKDLQLFLDNLTKVTTQIQGLVSLLDAFPWIVPFFPKFLLDKVGFSELKDTWGQLKAYLRRVVAERRATLDKMNPRGLVDAYLIELENKDSESYFDDEALIITLGDLFLAGSDTTATTIRWGLLYLALYPEVQRKIQEEIDATVSKDRRPRLSDKSNLPYTEAASYDILRVTTLTPFGLFHAASSDTMLDDFLIPKDSLIFAFIYGCHMDPRYWEKPKEFYPEHFIDENGKFTAKNEAFMPFAVGRRSCLGESLAKMELFLFLSALLQKFTFRFPDGEKISSVDRDPKSIIFGLPPKVKVIIEERK